LQLFGIQKYCTFKINKPIQNQPSMKSIVLSICLLFITSSFVMAQDYALTQLENSPRHHEWVQIEYNNRTLTSFVAFPETNETVPAVIVIHENRGLTDWVRSFADQVAEAGYIAIAPDLLSEFNDEYGRTSDFPSSDAARDALYQLDSNQITADLHQVRNYISSHPATNGKTVVAGFCWGGSQTFRFATNSDQIEAAFVFYGSAPTDEDAVQNISVPVYGFYGENDQRINSGIPAIESLMSEYGKTYEYEIYDEAGHAYMRAGDSPNGSESNITARNESWERLKQILADI
jgi:carboxymethylenebutenolidase